MLEEFAAAGRLLGAAKEAQRRDAAEAKRRKDRDGWSRVKGRWVDKAGEQVFDGPGSHVALFKHFEDVCREQGLQADAALVGAGVRRLVARVWGPAAAAETAADFAAAAADAVGDAGGGGAGDAPSA